MSTSLISARKRRANRSNALKSTGPQTVEGKMRSSRNATTHGMFCRHLVLAGESSAEFHLIREGMIASLSPQSLAELLMVDRIVSATWKLRRLQEAEADLLNYKAQKLAEESQENLREQLEDEDSPLADQLPIDVSGDIPVSMALSADTIDGDVLTRFSRYEQRLEWSIHRNLRELDRLRKLRDVREKNHEEEKPSPYRGNMRQVVSDLNLYISNMENEPTDVKIDAKSRPRQCLNDGPDAKSFRGGVSVT